MEQQIRARELRRGDVIADPQVDGGRLKVMGQNRSRGDVYVAVLNGTRVTSVVHRMTFTPNEPLRVFQRIGVDTRPAAAG